MVKPILSRFKIVNRSQRRKYEEESKRLSELLLPCVTGFLVALFEEDEMDYAELYNQYNESWIKGCELSDSLRPKRKVCDPNPHFFELTFRPLERIENKYELDNILKRIRCTEEK